MAGEEGLSPPNAGQGSLAAEESSKTVYFVPIYALAVVDPNKHAAKRRLSPEGRKEKTMCNDESVGARGLVVSGKVVRSKSAETGASVHHKRQKLIVMRKRGKIPDYDEDDPHKPTPKRLRNRMKAQKSRDKKKAYLTALEGKLDELGKVNSDLEERCNALQIENELMKNKFLDVNSAEKENLSHCDDAIHAEKETHFLQKSVENLENFMAESLDNHEGVVLVGRCSQINDEVCPGEGSTIEMQDCALEKYVWE